MLLRLAEFAKPDSGKRKAGLHAALKALAASDGVSLNTMAAVLIAEGVGKRNAHA